MKEDEFEIVGFYSILAPRSEVGFDAWKYYSINTFFVPLSHLPVSEAEAEAFPKLPGDWNAIISDVRQVESYEAGLAERLAVLNEDRAVTVCGDVIPVTVEVEVSDGDWHEVAENLQRAEGMALLSLGALVLAVLAASALVAYLFLGRKKKEYAIQRALGVPVKDANRSLLLPFCVLVLAATVIGGITALIYSRGTVASGLAELAAEGAVDTRISGWALLLSIVGELAAVGLFALLWVRRIAHLPPLTLLQEK